MGAISPDLTFLINKFGTTSVTAMKHEWLSDTLRGPQDNAKEEKVDFSTNEAEDRMRDGNYCQQFMDGFYVTDAQEKIAKHGVSSELSYQMLKTSKVIARDLEHAVLNSSQSQNMASGQAGRMGGVHYFIGGSAYTKVATFTAATDLVTLNAHGFRNGQLVSIYLAAGAVIPGGLVENKTYYVGAVTANTFKLFTTLAAAQAGTVCVDITSAGSGTINITSSNIISLNSGLTENAFNDMMEKAWLQGADIDSAVMSGRNKRLISTWTAGVVRNKDMGDERAKNVLSVYETDFGIVTTEAHRMATDDRIDFLEYQYWKLGYLIPFHVEDVNRKGTYKEKVITGIVTLECKSPNSNGSIINIA